MKIINNKQFESRNELDIFIRNTYGTDSIRNKELTMEIDEEELQKLFLSEKVTVYGVKIKKNG